MANLKYALVSTFGYNDLADGYHDILPEFVDGEYAEAYDGLTSYVGLLKFKIVSGSVDKAYRAILGLIDGKPVIRNNFQDFPVTPDESGNVLVCHSLVYISSLVNYPEDMLTFPVKVADLVELQALTEKGGGLLKVAVKDIPKGTYVLTYSEVKTAGTGTDAREFVVAKLQPISGKEIKLVGTVWDAEEKFAKTTKQAVLEFSTALNGRFKKVKPGSLIAIENHDGKSGQAFF